MKRKILIVFGLLFVIVFFGLQYQAMQQPEVQARMQSLLRDTPAHVFYPVVLGFMVLIVGSFAYILLNQGRWSRAATRGSVLNAKKVAMSLWSVETPRIIQGCPVIRFRHMSWGRWSFVLPVRPGHPDVERFSQLRHGDTVEFESLAKGMDCALEHELCGYLRIKSVS